MPHVRPGRALELLVAAIERVLAQNDKVSVESPKLLRDRITGDLREHDVVVTLQGSHHSTAIAIECRDRSRKVTVNDGESFWSKCHDTGVDQGIIVSPKGFSQSALKKAQNRGIRCLRLSEAQSFNWLLATGITVHHRRMIHTNWTFFPERPIDPKPIAFSILSADGDQIPSQNLVAAAYQEFQKIHDERTVVGRGVRKIMFTSPGLILRDDTTGKTYPVGRALAAVEYEVVEEYVPFNLVTYECSPTGELITDAAIAQLNVGGIKGKMMIVYKAEEGGTFNFVPDKTESVA